jgi:carbon storage regulator
MLIIRRKAGESIQIADNIVVHVLEISPTRVKLGICAPAEVEVLRPEARHSAAENVRASTSLPITPTQVLDILAAATQTTPDNPLP